MERHEHSLMRLVGPETTGTLPSMVSAVLADAGIATSSWASVRGWHLVDLDVAWVTSLSCELSHRSTGLGRLEIHLPWLLDARARTDAPPDVGAGRHEGLWFGGPRVPLTQLRDTPGVRVRWRSPQASLDPDEATSALRATVSVTPDAGGGLFFNDTRSGRAVVRRVWERTFHTLRRAQPEAHWVVTPAGLFSAETVAALRETLPDAFAPGDTPDVDALTAIVRAAIDTDRQRRETHGMEAFADATKFAPGTSGLRAYGDLLGEAVATTLQRQLRRAQWMVTSGRRSDKDGWLGPWLSRRIAHRVNVLLSGRHAITLPDQSQNTLALAETGRQVTVFGPHGLRPPVRGSLDFRDLHPGWRGVLCPVHTPESEHISLIRHLALADTTDDVGLDSWRDLSWSAALIPYLNHDEQARAILAAKNLKQCVPLISPDIPRVRTGVESLLAERHGVTRASARGVVARVESGAITIRTGRNPSGDRHPVGPAAPGGATGADWLTCVAPSEQVARGEVLAHAPDVRLDEDGQPHWAPGVDLMVAVTPWHGRNYEDAIVVSASAARRLRHRERTAASEDLWPGEWADPTMTPERTASGTLPDVYSGEVIATIRDASGSRLRRFRAPASGTLTSLDIDPVRQRITASIERTVAVEVGDKLTNRHGGKGVVAQIVPDQDMPRLPDGTVVDAIISPAGIVRRLNIGQVYEMAAGLLSLLDGTDHVIAGRTVADRAELASGLAAHGASGGRLPLHDAEDGVLFDGSPVLVGPQHFLKLHHFAEQKLSVRAGGAVSPVTGQPTRGTTYRDGERVGSGQRLGEMELWALQAMGAKHLLADALHERGGATGPVRPVLTSVVNHLAATGLLVAPGDELGPDEPDPGWPEPQALASAEAFHVIPSRWRFLRPMAPEDFVPDAADPEAHPLHGARFCPPEDDMRVTRCFQLPVAFAAGGRIDQGPVAVHPPGAATSTWVRGDALDALVRMSGCVASVHARAMFEGAEGTPALADLWLATASRWLPRLLGGAHAPAWEDVEQLLREPTPADRQWAVEATRLLPLLDRWTDRLPILPPGLRPQGRDRLDVLYLRLADALGLSSRGVDDQHALRLVHTIIGVDRTSAALMSPRVRAQVEPRSVLARLTGKSGLLREALLGTSTFYSGRGVIVPDPDRHPGTVGLPWRLHAALCSNSDPEDPTSGTVFIVRQPTLRPANIAALTAEPVSGHSIHLHPNLCEALAGDFDGDTVAVHRPQSAVARAEAQHLFGSSASLRNPASGGFLAKTDLDLALGQQILTDQRTDGTTATFLEGLDGLDADEAVGRLAALQRERWEAATGWSLGFVDLPSLGHLAPLEGSELDDALSTALGGTALGTLHRAGAAGKTAALRQLLVGRGVHRGFNALLPDTDIAGCFIDGLDDTEWFLGARAGAARLAEKKLLTPHAGGFTKLLAEIAYEVEVGQNDCETPAEPRSPLTCADSMPCAACVGRLPHGVVPQPGLRIGLLAAMLVGERSTQLAMKTFHAGASGAVDLTTLRSLFGQGPAPLFAKLLQTAGVDGEPTLSGWLDAASRLPQPHDGGVGAHLHPVSAAIEAGFNGAVARVWIDILLKQLFEVWRRGAGSGGLARTAKLHGRDPLAVSTIHGAAPAGAVPDELLQHHRITLLAGRRQA